MNKRRTARRIESRARQMRPRIVDWLEKFRDRQIAQALKQLRTGKLKLAKADITDEDLVEILTMFGLRHINTAASDVADSLGGTWVIPPQLIASVINSKKIKVKGIIRGMTNDVREAIRDIMASAEREIPQPSIGELSRRIREGIGDRLEYGDGRPGLIARAGLIARTESLQNEAKGIYNGMKESGVEEIEWLSSGNPNHGKRRHDLMNGMKVKLGEYFTNPTTGKKLRYPGDPSASIGETANCGCTYAPV